MKKPDANTQWNKDPNEAPFMVITAQQMQPPTMKPCAQCPLRRSATPGYLGGYTPEEYVQILHGPASIACHLSPGFETKEIARQRHCTGVSGYRANVGHLPFGSANAAVRMVGHSHVEFFSSPEQFIEHHRPKDK